LTVTHTRQLLCPVRKKAKDLSVEDFPVSAVVLLVRLGVVEWRGHFAQQAVDTMASAACVHLTMVSWGGAKGQNCWVLDLDSELRLAKRTDVGHLVLSSTGCTRVTRICARRKRHLWWHLLR